MNQQYTTTIFESDDDDLIIELPLEIVEGLDLVVGDDLVWCIRHDGSFTVKRKL